MATDGNRISELLKAFLGLVFPRYARLKWKPWHMGIVVRTGDNPLVFEGWFPRARVAPLPVHRDYKVITWLSKPPSQAHVDEFVRTRLGAWYDLPCYAWTIIARALRLPIPRINDLFFTCWELAADFALWCGEPWHDMYTWPLITDFLEAVGMMQREETWK
jgi:hypothetical protein